MTEERLKIVSIDIDFLTRTFFYFDEPVPYQVEGGTLNITPVSVKNSEIFLSSADILTIDKNSLPDVKIIQMSYLQYICDVLLQNKNTQEIDKIASQKFLNILMMCLQLTRPAIGYQDNIPFLYDETSHIKITAKQFEDIKSIIMYQNIVEYDEEYINPELKKAMMEVDELNNKNVTIPSLERKIAIITAHTGLSKKDQLAMTYRSHSLLFKEVCGEVAYSTARPGVIAVSGKDSVDSWIFKPVGNKFERYVQSVDSYSNSMGGSQIIKSSDNTSGELYIQQFNNFNK